MGSLNHKREHLREKNKTKKRLRTVSSRINHYGSDAAIVTMCFADFPDFWSSLLFYQKLLIKTYKPVKIKQQ